MGIEHSQRTNLLNKYIKLLASGFIQPNNFPEYHEILINRNLFIQVENSLFN